MSQQLYQDLGVSPAASSEEIKAAHRSKSRSSHPDKGGDEETFCRINAAYQVLKDDTARAHYDATGDMPETAPTVSPGEKKFLEILEQEIVKDPFLPDLLPRIRRIIKQKIARFGEEIPKIDRSIAISEKQLARFTLADSEDPEETRENLILSRLQQMHSAARRQQEEYLREKAAWEEALLVLEWHVDSAEVGKVEEHAPMMDLVRGRYDRPSTSSQDFMNKLYRDIMGDTFRPS